MNIKTDNLNSCNSKTFFSKTSELNKDGLFLAEALDKHIQKVYIEYINLGFNLREITQIIISSTTLIEARTSLDYSDKIKLAKRKSTKAIKTPKS